MQTNDYAVHHTFTNRIPDSEGGGLEFWCVECTYRVRYLPHGPAASQQLQVLDSGDPQALHTSSQISEMQLEDLTLSEPMDWEIPADDWFSLENEAYPEEEEWLTTPIRVFLARLMQRLDS